MKAFSVSDFKAWRCAPQSADGYVPDVWSGTALDLLGLSTLPFATKLNIIFRPELVSDKLMREFSLWCVRQVADQLPEGPGRLAVRFMGAYCEGRYLLADAEWGAIWEKERSEAYLAAWSTGTATSRAATAVASPDARWSALQASALTEAAGLSFGRQEEKLRQLLIGGIETGDTK